MFNNVIYDTGKHLSCKTLQAVPDSDNKIFVELPSLTARRNWVKITTDEAIFVELKSHLLNKPER